ncbi:MAG: hypothetical protein ACR2PM_16990 [Hyphomicrobiales bacterium]
MRRGVAGTFAVLLAVSGVGLAMLSNSDGGGETEPGGTAAASARSSQCTARGGTWLDAQGECEWIDQAACSAMGGQFNGCASACRHQPEAVVCVQVCVPVCSWR